MKQCLRLFFLVLFAISFKPTFAQDIPEHSGPGVTNFNNFLHNQNFKISGTNGTQAINLVLPGSGTSANSRAPQGGNTIRYARCVYLITAAELQAYGVPSGVNFSSLGFSYAAAQNTPTAGTFQVYFQNTADVANNMSTTWSTAISTMTRVDSSNDNIPAALTFDHNLSSASSFTYTGGGLYIAWEYSNPTSPVATAYNIAYCNTALVNGLKSQQSATVLPATLAASSFRPDTRLGYLVGTDASVQAVYTLGKLPLGFGVPHTISAVVSNTGDNIITALPCTLTVKGSNSFTDIQTIASIPVGGSATVTFSSFSPTVVGADTVTVNVPADGNLMNNSSSIIHTVNNTNTFAYTNGATFTAATLPNALSLGAAAAWFQNFMCMEMPY